MDEVKITRNYKDTLFGSLFYSCEDAVENAKALYKALTGREVKHVEKCRLEDVLFRQFLNDVLSQFVASLRQFIYFRLAQVFWVFYLT